MSGWKLSRIELRDQGFDRWRLVADHPGPRIVVLGGIHGDETEGVLAAGRLTTLRLPLRAGTLDVVPVCHELAFRQDRRTSPLDDGNLARHFPGDPTGSPTSRLAWHLTEHVLSGADLLIDLHTAGLAYDMPFLVGLGAEAYGNSDLLARSAAESIEADFLWVHPHIDEGRTLRVVPAGIYLEAPGGGPTNPATVDRYVNGVLRALCAVGLLPAAVLRDITSGTHRGRPVRVFGGGNLDRDMARADADGLFLASVSCGERVAVDQDVGRVIDVRGQTRQTVRATRSGRVMALKRRSTVQEGDDLVLIASEDPEEVGKSLEPVLDGP